MPALTHDPPQSPGLGPSPGLGVATPRQLPLCPPDPTAGDALHRPQPPAAPPAPGPPSTGGRPPLAAVGDNEVYALVGRSEVADYPRRPLHLWVLWGDGSELTEESLAEIKQLDRMMELAAMKALALQLPAFRIQLREDFPERQARAWWRDLDLAERGRLYSAAQQCRTWPGSRKRRAEAEAEALLPPSPSGGNAPGAAGAAAAAGPVGLAPPPPLVPPAAPGPAPKSMQPAKPREDAPVPPPIPFLGFGSAGVLGRAACLQPLSAVGPSPY